MNIRESENIEMMEHSMLVIRNYIYKCSRFPPEGQSEGLKNNMIHLLFYLVSEIYKRPPTDYNGELDIVSSTCLLIYLL
jgi:hypothetical protein